MNRTEILALSRQLESIAPGGRPYLFLFASDDGSGAPFLHVASRRIGPEVQLGLMKQGGRRIVQGKISRGTDGFLVFSGDGVNEKKVGALVEELAEQLPILAGARVG